MTTLKLTAAAFAMTAFGGIAVAADTTTVPADPGAMQNQKMEKSNVRPTDPSAHDPAALPSDSGSTGASSGESGVSSGSAPASDAVGNSNHDQQTSPSGKGTRAGGSTGQ